MILQITDKKKSITVVNIMMFELDDESAVMKIWDFADNTASVQFENAYRAEQCVRNLFSSGKASAEGEIVWS